MGQTGGTLYQRMQVNFSFIWTGKPDVMALHFSGSQHSVRDIAVIGIKKLNRTKKAFWIMKMRTRIRYGLNTMTS